MNKYFKIMEDFEKQTGIDKYTLVYKFDIALELEALTGDIELTDKQEEAIIELIYNLYMDCDNINLSTYHYVKATIETLNNYENYDKFMEAYIDNAEDVEIEIRENIEY